jgi:hypothetical protein
MARLNSSEMSSLYASKRSRIMSHRSANHSITCAIIRMPQRVCVRERCKHTHTWASWPRTTTPWQRTLTTSCLVPFPLALMQYQRPITSVATLTVSHACAEGWWPCLDKVVGAADALLLAGQNAGGVNEGDVLKDGCRHLRALELAQKGRTKAVQPTERLVRLHRKRWERPSGGVSLRHTHTACHGRRPFHLCLSRRTIAGCSALLLVVHDGHETVCPPTPTTRQAARHACRPWWARGRAHRSWARAQCGRLESRGRRGSE